MSWNYAVPSYLGATPAHDIKSIAAGSDRSLAVKGDGTVISWGLTRYVDWDLSTPVLSDVTAVAVGSQHSLALKSDGTVVTWGYNPFGVPYPVPAGLSGVTAIAAGGVSCLALKSDGTVVAWDYMHPNGMATPSGLQNVVAIAAGGNHFLALNDQGALFAWGDNSKGQCDTPPGMTPVRAIAAGGNFTVILRGDYTVAVWGDNALGQCNVPLGLPQMKAISAGADHSLALTHDGAVVAWGNNDRGQCNVPAGLSGVLAIAAGNGYSLALKADGAIVAWGDNRSGQSVSPTELVDVTAIAAGGAHRLALRSNGAVITWGRNERGQCNVPAEARNVIDIAAGESHSLALQAGGRVFAWGDNSKNQCSVPPGIDPLCDIAAGYAHSIGLRLDRTVVAWGDNTYGQLAVPVGLDSVNTIAAGEFHNLALKSNGTVVAWGDNTYGQCDVPPGLTGVSAIAAGSYYSLALKGDGTVVGWGDNHLGQCNAPAGLSGVVAIAAGYAHGLAIKADGSIVVWGEDTWHEHDAPWGRALAIAAYSVDSMALMAANHPPLANADALVTVANTAAAVDVLANDRDPDGDPITLTDVTPGAHGAVAITASGVVTYTPNPNYSGPDSFAYGIRDKWGATAIGGVTVNVNPAHPVNHPPNVNAGGLYSAEKNGNQASVVLNAAFISDPDGDQLIYHWSTNAPGALILPSPDEFQPTLTFDASAGLGTYYQVTLTVSDGLAFASASANVKVVDTAPPVITLNGDPVVTLEAGHSLYLEWGAHARDAAEGELPVFIHGDEQVDPNKVGTYLVTFDAEDSSGNRAVQVIRTIHVVDTTAPTITLNGANPLTLSVGGVFNDPGAVAHDWADGDFPATASGLVNTAVAGSYTVTYNATDQAGHAAAPVTRTVIIQPVSGAAAIKVIAPAPGAAWPQGSTQTIRWTSQNVTGKVALAVSLDGGASWRLIAASVPNTGAYSWPVTQGPSANALIGVASVANPAVYGTSGRFTIPPRSASITVLAPLAGQRLSPGVTTTIRWLALGAPGPVDLALSLDDGASWQPIAAGVANIGQYAWTVSGRFSDVARIRVRSAAYPSIAGQSNRFTITAPRLTVTQPAAGAIWRAGTLHLVSWSSLGLPVTARVKIQLSTNGGASWTTIAANVPNLGGLLWVVPARPSAQACIRVSYAQNPAIYDDSGLFTIQ